MSDVAEFALRLANEFSKPARDISHSQRQLRDDMRSTQKVFAQGDSTFQKGLKARRSAFDRERRAIRARREALAQRRDVGFQRQQLRQRQAELKARREAIRQEGLEPGMGIASKAGILAVAGIVVTAAAAAGFLAAKITSATVAAVDFGQRSKTALASILKSGPLAAQQFDQVRNEAERLGLNVTDTVDEFKMLANSGFSVPMARELVRMSADLQALTGNSMDASLALRAISQIKMKGRLQAEEITGQLAEHGVSADEVYKELGKTLGKTREEILKMQKAGDISADMAIPAILQAVRNQLGVQKSGGFALSLNTSSIGGMFRMAQAQVQNAFISLGERVGPGITAAFQSIMSQLQSAIASPQAQALGQAVVSLFDAVSSLAGDTDFATLIKEGAEALGGEIRSAAQFIRDNGAEIRESFMTFVRFMGVGLKAAADFFKPFIALATSDFVQSLMMSPDQFREKMFEQQNPDGTFKSPAQRRAEDAARNAGAVMGGPSNTFNVTLSGDTIVQGVDHDGSPKGAGEAVGEGQRAAFLRFMQEI